MEKISVIPLANEDEIQNALTLVWSVFLEYEAPDYTPEGIKEFYLSIHNNAFLERLTFFAAYQEEKMVGVIATRNHGTHIALFFVDGHFQKQGIGRKMFTEALEQNTSDFVTVNSSPYAVPVYHKLGFQDTDAEQAVNGLKFTPMKLTLS